MRKAPLLGRTSGRGPVARALGRSAVAALEWAMVALPITVGLMLVIGLVLTNPGP